MVGNLNIFKSTAWICFSIGLDIVVFPLFIVLGKVFSCSYFSISILEVNININISITFAEFQASYTHGQN